MESLDPEVLRQEGDAAVQKLIQDAIDTGCLRLYIRFFPYLARLPVYIGFAKSVRLLCVNHNDAMQAVPAVISDLAANLTHLDLSHNALVSLPDSFTQLVNLTKLDLSYNCLTTLPFGMHSGLRHLQQLNVSHNHVAFYHYDIKEFAAQAQFVFHGHANSYLRPSSEEAFYVALPLNASHCAVCGQPLAVDETVKGPLSAGGNTLSPYGMSYVSFEEAFFGIRRCPFVYYVCQTECFLQCYRRKAREKLLKVLPVREVATPTTTSGSLHEEEEDDEAPGLRAAPVAGGRHPASPVHDRHCRCTSMRVYNDDLLPPPPTTLSSSPTSEESG